MKVSALLKTAALGLALACNTAAFGGEDDDIYTVHFSADGKHIITGGAGGFTLSEKDKYTGGIKIWDSETGDMIDAMGQRSDLDTIFGTQYGRVGDTRWGISNFKDVVLTGSYPQGKVLLLPSSLGRMANNSTQQMPDFIGGYIDLDSHTIKRIKMSQLSTDKGNCDPKTGFHDYVGPIVPSNNGRYAAIVVNTCKAVRDNKDRQVGFEYRSDLHVMDLSKFSVIQTVNHLDAGVYALGITDNGQRVAYVGRDQFAVLDLDSGERHVVESYPDSAFMIPRQFSTLRFSQDGHKLISLRNIYDIDSGTEKTLKWTDTDAKKPMRISNISVAPDLSYFAMVVPKRSLIMFGDDGLPHSYGKADKVILLDASSGERTELEITKSMTEGKRCVTDISPDSERVAVGCKGGLLRVFNARTGEMVWQKQNIGQKHDNGLMNVRFQSRDSRLSLAQATRW